MINKKLIFLVDLANQIGDDSLSDLNLTEKINATTLQDVRKVWMLPLKFAKTI
jgi:hypothetical protein